MDVKFLIFFLLVAVCDEATGTDSGMDSMEFHHFLPKFYGHSSSQLRHEVFIKDQDDDFVLGSIIDEGKYIVALAIVFLDDWEEMEMIYKDNEEQEITTWISKCERVQNVHLTLLTPSSPINVSDNVIKILPSVLNILHTIPNDYDVTVSNYGGSVTIHEINHNSDGSVTITTDYLGDDNPKGSSLILRHKKTGEQYLIGLFHHSHPNEENPERSVSVFSLVDEGEIKLLPLSS